MAALNRDRQGAFALGRCLIRLPAGVKPFFGFLPVHVEAIVHCKMGGRSAKACDILRTNEFKQAKNVLVGITTWSDKVDPTVPKY